MGCDIHCHIEYKLPSDAAYNWFASPNIHRSYPLFAILAGVRSDWVLEIEGVEISPMIAPRGIPENASHYTLKGDDGWFTWCPERMQWFEDDYHNPSWLNADEFRGVLEIYDGFIDEDCREYAAIELRAVLSAMEVLPEARLVFWFDN